MPAFAPHIQRSKLGASNARADACCLLSSPQIPTDEKIESADCPIHTMGRQALHLISCHRGDTGCGKRSTERIRRI